MDSDSPALEFLWQRYREARRDQVRIEDAIAQEEEHLNNLRTHRTRAAHEAYSLQETIKVLAPNTPESSFSIIQESVVA